MKKCPFCAEKIQDAAIVCRYCGRELPTIDTPRSEEQTRSGEQTKSGEQTRSAPNRFLLMGLLLLGAAILAAGGYFLFGKRPTAAAPSAMEATSPATATPRAATPPDRPVLYALDFENKAALTSWHVGGPGTDPAWLQNTQDGRYVSEYASGYIETEDFQFSGIEVSADVAFLSQARVDASVSCRLHQGSSYLFRIANDGRWWILKWYKGETVLAEGWSAEIQPDANRLSGRCAGQDLTLLVNGVALGSGQDGDLTTGAIGLSYNADKAGAVAFDNLLVEDWGNGEPAAPQAVVEPATATPSATATAAPIPTAVPTLRPTLIPEETLTLYQTEFETTDETLARWKTFAYSFTAQGFVTEGYNAGPINGVYRIRTSDPAGGENLRVFSIYDADAGSPDADISLRALAPNTGGVGLVCRYSEAGWYQFMFEPHGMWSVRLVKYDDAGQLRFHTISAGRRWPGQKVNLRAECKSDRLTFFIDGEKLASLRDSTFADGKVGVLGWSFDIPGEITMIDYFTVQRAQWSESDLPGPAPTPAAEGALYATDFSRMEDLKPHWIIQDAGVLGLAGSNRLFGGPGGATAPHTYRYINDFDPGPDVEISASIRQSSILARGLICRYSEDGWYQAHHQDDPDGDILVLVRVERDEQGQWRDVILGMKGLPDIDSVNLTLSCAGNQIGVALNGEMALYAEDATWPSGRYGFMFMENPPGNIRYAFTSYSIRPAAAQVQTGQTVFTQVSETVEQIGFNWTIFYNSDPNVTVQDNAIVLVPGAIGSGIQAANVIIAQNIEATFDLEFEADSYIYLQCRGGSPNRIGFGITSDGGWFIDTPVERLLEGRADAIADGKNQFTIRCVDQAATLAANGEALASVEIPEFIPAAGNAVFISENGSRVRLNKLTLSVMQAGPLPPASTHRNQVSIPSYAPGEAIYTFREAKIYSDLWCPYHKYSAYWEGPCFNPKDQPLETIQVPSEKTLFYWIYYRDLYDLPVEISAETTFAGKGGGIGLFCRNTEAGRYVFLIQPDGRWYIRRDKSEWYNPRAANITTLAYGTSADILPGANQISATCSGSQLIFLANGKELGRVEDSLYPEGQPGILFDPYTPGSFTELNLRRAE